MVALRMDIKNFFFDRPKVKRMMDEATRLALNRVGSRIRIIARRSLRLHAQKKISELTKKERRLWRIRQNIARRAGKKPPRRPIRRSRPGDPPRVKPYSQLKSLLEYGYDPNTASVVIGPEGFKRSKVPDVLEHGGLGSFMTDAGRPAFVEARPFMGPALDTYLPNIPPQFRDRARTV